MPYGTGVQARSKSERLRPTTTLRSLAGGFSARWGPWASPISPWRMFQMFKSRTLASAAVVALLASLSFASVASAGPRKQTNAEAAAACTVSGNVVTATGLPHDVILNFMMSDADGKYGWALGLTWDGTGEWAVNVPDREGATTYEFVSETFGKGGSKYIVYAS